MVRNLQNQFKMKKYFVLIAAVVMISMASCTPAKKEVNQQNPMPPIVQSDTSSKILSVPETFPETGISKVPPVIDAAAIPPKLNPAHGQPFHRCDIAVGSPLSAAPAKPAATAISTGAAPTLENAARLNNPRANTTTTPSVPSVTNANATPPKLNPPHGQPFHRCEIPVGSPLN